MTRKTNDNSRVQPQVSIFIPCYNEEATIQRLLTALKDQTFPTSNIEVIIADGLSTDNTKGIINSFAEENQDLAIRIIDNEKRFIPHALNLAAKAASGDILIRMDAHSIPALDYVECCVKALLENKGDNVGGRWNIQPSKEGYIARSIAIAASHPLGSGGANYRSGNKAQKVDTVPFGAYKRETFERVGPFNESLLANEDYEWNMRLIADKGTVWFDPAINCIYFSRGTYKALAKQYFNYGYWKVKMLKLYPKTLRLRQLLPPVVTLLLVLSATTTIVSLLAGAPLLAALTAVMLLAYFTLLTLGVALSTPGNAMKLIPGIVGSISCMHFSWGFGFIYSAMGSFLKKTD
ncbi:glycosyltransferase family 2 protein [Rubellicoccus peritrichatus]|uniref:Glycosyltransferase family 2 protein n=1 Tax=Rubellicoccus peritrichatus TaxID=3080537 RepID=A0AAQ3L865_9BACT|nr:glycosyltransferase family 2 protein [Puniceicoccus sp. CR14]WOO41444.1 glycosyltransferase family 2 protein [Puniceicoccus sp. CR14]